MLVLPALLLRRGIVTAPGAGEYLLDRAPLSDPLACARLWADLGFTRLHVVDLDAAAGRGTNQDVIFGLLRDGAIPLQVGGGLRTTDAVERVLDAGARHVIVGTKAMEDPDWLREAADAFPQELVVAADVRARRVVSRGWSRTLALELTDAIAELNDLPLAGLLVTAVHREAERGGADLRLMEDAAEATDLPVTAAGGIQSFHDLRSLENRGLAAAVVGAGLYNAAMDSRLVADEFSA